jgi:hypothetical protein
MNNQKSIEHTYLFFRWNRIITASYFVRFINIYIYFFFLFNLELINSGYWIDKQFTVLDNKTLLLNK